MEGQTVKVGDFGQSKKFSDALNSSVNDLAMAIDVRPPEKIAMKTAGRGADSWALGVLLYRMCSFEYPFGDPFLGSNFKGFIKNYQERILNEEPDWSEIPEIYSEKTKEFCRRLLEKEREKRPLIKDIINELEEHCSNLIKESKKVKINLPKPENDYTSIIK